MAHDLEAVKLAAKSLAADVRRELPVDRAFLYGSYAKGAASELSDVDVCFFLRDYGGRERTEMINLILNLGGKYQDIFFEPLVFPTAEIERGNPFVDEILNTGEEI